MSRRDDLDVDDTLQAVLDNLWTADANITAAERMIAESRAGIEAGDEGEKRDEDSYGHGGDDDPGRLQNHLLVYAETAKAAVRAAQYAHSLTVDKLQRYRAESDQVVETTTALSKRRGKA